MTVVTELVFVVWQRPYRGPGQNTEPLPEIIGVYTTKQKATAVQYDGPTGYYRQIKETWLVRQVVRPKRKRKTV